MITIHDHYVCHDCDACQVMSQSSSALQLRYLQVPPTPDHKIQHSYLHHCHPHDHHDHHLVDHLLLPDVEQHQRGKELNGDLPTSPRSRPKYCRVKNFPSVTLSEPSRNGKLVPKTFSSENQSFGYS